MHNKTVITSLRHMSIFFFLFPRCSRGHASSTSREPVSQKKENLLVNDTRIRFEVHLVLTTYFAIITPRPGLIAILINLTCSPIFFIKFSRYFDMSIKRYRTYQNKRFVIILRISYYLYNDYFVGDYFDKIILINYYQDRRN